ncbi:MAG: DUF1841 family protein [Pseudomonadota bacterium]
MFVENRDDARRFFYQVWSKVANAEPLEPLENLVAEVIRAHPEYQALLTDPSSTKHDFTDGVNPFLHLGLHIALIEQLQTDRPTGILQIFKTLSERYGDPHQAEHQMMTCLAGQLQQASERGIAPDPAAYLTELERLR